MFNLPDKDKRCFAYCGDGVCDCGIADDFNYSVDYPCDVEPPYDDEESEKSDQPTTDQPSSKTSP